MKIAASDFLNAQPLIYGLEEPDFSLRLASPKDCAQALSQNEVDIALIPSIEYAKMDNLWVVPDVCISSEGPVCSVLLFLKKQPFETQTIAVDERSRTALTLLKILERHYFESSFQYAQAAADLKVMLQTHDGALLIGDQALKASLDFDGVVIDLGKAWQELTELPFTYAFWAGKNENVARNALIQLIEAKERGLHKIETIAKIHSGEFPLQFLLDYLTKNICYDWSLAHEKGLKLFYEMAFRQRLISKIPEIKFYDIEKNILKSAGWPAS